ncbi:hypothetical protein J0S82_004255, partial [Galemys pyrenaicus]
KGQSARNEEGFGHTGPCSCGRNHWNGVTDSKDDDNTDLFDSDDEGDEEESKTILVANFSIFLDMKPCSGDTHVILEERVRNIHVELKTTKLEQKLEKQIIASEESMQPMD